MTNRTYPIAHFFCLMLTLSISSISVAQIDPAASVDGDGDENSAPDAGAAHVSDCQTAGPVGSKCNIGNFAGIGSVPFDHDKFLQFPETQQGDSLASGDAYYQTIDPDNLRTTLDDWKAINGFIEPLPNTNQGLAAMGITHALYLNATDLGFVRNIYARTKANGDVVALLENFPSFERTFNQSFDERLKACNNTYDPGLPKEQQCTSGGIDAFQYRDLSGMLASVVMEYSAVKSGGPKFTQFYGFTNDGTRVSALDLTGRGKAEAFPGLCAVCHGGNPGGVDALGKFVPPDLAYAGAENGNFGGGFLPFDPDLYEYHDPDGVGAEIGSGEYSRANQELAFKDLNRLVLTTDPTRAARELVEGWYGGAGLPASFNGHFVPVGWAQGAEDTAFYQSVMAPYCRACHIQRAFPESASNVNTQEVQLDFNDQEDFDGLYNQIGATVFSRTTMPLAVVTYNKFWSDVTAVTGFIDYMEFRLYSEVIPKEEDGSGNLVAVMPGRPIAIPGSYVDQVVGKPIQLDGLHSLSADNYSWSVVPNDQVNLINPSSATPTLIVNKAGEYTLTLIVSNDEKTDSTGTIRPADISIPVSTSINVIGSPFLRVTFESSIKNSPDNARCLKCHSPPATAGYENFNFHHEILKMSELGRSSYVQGNFISRLLYKPAGLLADYDVRDGVHSGGRVIRETDAYFSLLKNWIEDGECNIESGCQRISVTNENTALEIDPLSPFMIKSLSVALAGVQPAHGTLSPGSNQKLIYSPERGFTGLDSYTYLVMDPQTGSTGMITDKIYVFPDLGFIPGDFTERFSEQFPGILPSVGLAFEFEKVNTDGDAIPNYLDDFPNNRFTSRDHDGDGIPDRFNANISSAEALASGISIDLDDDNDGVPDVSDDQPLDPTRSVYIDSDRDGFDDDRDPYPFDMTGTEFEDFESGDLNALPWVGSGPAFWSIVPKTDIPGHHPLVGEFAARTPPLNNNESADLTINLTVVEGYVSFWYFLSSESCCDLLTFYIDGLSQELDQTSNWSKVSLPVAAGNHTFSWIYEKDVIEANGLDAAWIDSIEFSGPLDSDVDGASEALDNCPAIPNSNQNDFDGDGTGDACDPGDSDGDNIADNVEVAQGLDPADPDSDGDGVDDGDDAFHSDPAASIDSDGDGRPDVLIPGVVSTSTPPLTIDLEPFNPRSGLDIDGDRVGDNAIYTVAGKGTYGFSGDGGLATAAELTYPEGLTIDAFGNLFIADTNNHRIRRVDTNTGIITTVAGTGAYGFSGDGGLATAADLYSPQGLTIDAFGNLFIADSYNDRIRRVDANTGVITTVAGTGTKGFSGDGGLATAADLYSPQGLAIDAFGNLFIADDYNDRIRRVDANTGVITTVAGTGTKGFSGDGGLATAADIYSPQELAIDAFGNLFIADSINDRVRRVDTNTGIITTVAGTGTYGFSGDGGLATAADLDSPQGLAIDASGNLFIADTYNHRIRRVDANTGAITTVAGTGMNGFSGDGGLATAADLDYPQGLTLDSSGTLFVADSSNHRVLQVSFLSTSDQFPYNPAASVDTDGDGFPDFFNSNATPQQIAASGLILDAFPDDPTAAVDMNHDGISDYYILGGELSSFLPLPNPEPLIFSNSFE